MSEIKRAEDVRPTDDRILVEVVEGDAMVGGIEIPEAFREKSHRARVVSAGPGRLLDDGSRAELGVAVGETVLHKRGGTEIKIEGRAHLVLRERDVLAVIIGEENP